MRHTLGISIFLLLVTLSLSNCTTITSSGPGNENGSTRNLSWPEREKRLSSMEQWQIKGKIGVQTNQDSGSANVDWTRRGRRYFISLYGPFGSGGLTLNGQPGGVAMVDAKGHHSRAGSPESLLAREWGYQVPISNLNYWVRGIPVPGLTARTQLDTQHRLVTLYQSGWIVQYQDYTTVRGIDLPQRITMTSNSLRAKLIIYSWSI